MGGVQGTRSWQPIKSKSSISDTYTHPSTVPPCLRLIVKGSSSGSRAGSARTDMPPPCHPYAQNSCGWTLLFESAICPGRRPVLAWPR